MRSRIHWCCAFALLVSVTAFAQEPPPIPDDPVAAAMQKLDLHGRICQLVLATMQGQQRPSLDDMNYLAAYPPGGVVVRRLLNPEGAANYTAKLRSSTLASGIPLLIGADLYALFQHEGPAAQAFLPLPSMLSLAAAGDEASTARAGQLLASHLRGMGFDLHLGPSLALSPQLSDVQGSIHHLGDNPAFVGKTGTTIFQQLAAHGVLPMPMQFPGGALNRRGNQSPAVLLTPAALLPERDLAPYIQAIKSGARILHVGNTLVPAIDPDSGPASLSAAVMNDLLRGDLGYGGVILAGPLDHLDVAAQHDVADAAQRALLSGADMIYIQGPITVAVRVVDKLVAAVAAGTLPESVINAAARRVLKLKMDWALQSAAVSPDLKTRRSRGAMDEIFAVERRAITLLQNRNGVLPLSKDKSLPAGVTGVVRLDDFRDALEKHVKPFAQQEIATARHLGDIQDFEIHRITSRIKGLKTAVCVVTDRMRPSGPIKLIRELKAQGAAVVVVFLGYPNYVDQLVDADAIVLAYCDVTNHAATLHAIADVLCGIAPLRVMSSEDFLGTGREFTVRAGQPLAFDVADAVQTPAGRLPLRLSDHFPSGQAVRFDPSESIKKVRWDFGDGKHETKSQASYTFDAVGRYPVTLTVTDTTGAEESGTFHVTVTQ